MKKFLSFIMDNPKDTHTREIPSDISRAIHFYISVFRVCPEFVYLISIPTNEDAEQLTKQSRTFSALGYNSSCSSYTRSSYTPSNSSSMLSKEVSNNAISSSSSIVVKEAYNNTSSNSSSAVVKEDYHNTPSNLYSVDSNNAPSNLSSVLTKEESIDAPSNSSSVVDMEDSNNKPFNLSSALAKEDKNDTPAPPNVEKDTINNLGVGVVTNRPTRSNSADNLSVYVKTHGLSNSTAISDQREDPSKGYLTNLLANSKHLRSLGTIAKNLSKQYSFPIRSEKRDIKVYDMRTKQTNYEVPPLKIVSDIHPHFSTLSELRELLNNYRKQIREVLKTFKDSKTLDKLSESNKSEKVISYDLQPINVLTERIKSLINHMQYNTHLNKQIERKFSRVFDDFLPQEIISDVLLGSFRPASNLRTLKDFRITNVVCCVGVDPAHKKCFNYLIMNLEDNLEQNIKRFFPQAILYIRKALAERGRVYIHCGAGISRAPTICAAYLMYELQIPLYQALMLIKDARPCVNPNAAFIKQLKEWQNDINSGINIFTNDRDFQYCSIESQPLKNVERIGKGLISKSQEIHAT